MTGATTAGIQRATWDLRFAPASLAPPPPPDAASDPYYTPPSGSLVMPGRYKVSMAKRVDGILTTLAAPQEFNVTVEGLAQMSVQDRAALVEFQQRVTRLQRAVNGATETANSLKPRLALIKRALLDTPNAGDKLLDDAANIEKRLNEILRVLRGDVIIQARNENTAPSISDRVFSIIGAQRMSTYRPTPTQITQYTVAAQDFEKVLAQLRSLVQNDLARLEKEMEAAGAPWTPGRIPEWKEQ
jgi:hypothetical protein